MKITNYRAIKSGDILELFEYERPLGYDFTYKRSGFSESTQAKTEQEKQDDKDRSLRQTKSRLRRLINSNAGQHYDEQRKVYNPKFVTLTFRDDIQDLTVANEYFTNFIKRFNYFFDNNKGNHLKYISVPEFTKKGRAHLHTLFFNLHWFNANELADIWKHGFIKITDTDNITNLAPYVTKYLTKDALDQRLVGRKKYFSSRNLKYPIRVRDHIIAERIHLATDGLETEFMSLRESEHFELITYKVIDLKKYPLLKESLEKFIGS